MSTKTPLIIFGSSEMASLAHFYFTADSDYVVEAFTVDDEYVSSSSLLGLPLIPFSQVLQDFPPETHRMHVALSYSGMNRLRQLKFEQCKKAGYQLASYVCSKSVFWDDLTFGDNCFILENQTIQPEVVIRDNVTLWSGNHIGHGTTICSHAYVASHVVLSGHCQIGERCFLGVNSTCRDFVKIGSDVFVSMNAAVVSDVEDGSVVMGTSGKVYGASDRRSRALKRKYFGRDTFQSKS